MLMHFYVTLVQVYYCLQATIIQNTIVVRMVSLMITRMCDVFNRTRSRVRKNNTYLHRAAEEGKQLEAELVYFIVMCHSTESFWNFAESFETKG